VGSIRAQVSVVDRATSLEWIVPGTTRLTLRPGRDPDPETRQPALVGFVALDPQRVGPAEQPLEDGAWDVVIRWLGLGMQATGGLRLTRKARSVDGPPIPPALVGRPVRWVVPRADMSGALRIGIGGPDRVPARMDDAARRVLRQGNSVSIELPIATERSGPIVAGTLRLTGDAGVFDLPASIDGALGLLVVTVDDVTAGGAIPRGRYVLTAHIGGEAAPGVSAGGVVVRDDGRFVVLGLQQVSQVLRVRSVAAWTARAAGRAMRGQAVAAYRRLPTWAKDVVRAGYGRLRA